MTDEKGKGAIAESEIRSRRTRILAGLAKQLSIVVSLAALIISLLAFYHTVNDSRQARLVRTDELLGEVNRLLPDPLENPDAQLDQPTLRKVTELLTRARILTPKHFVTEMQWARLHFLQGDYTESEVHLQIAESINPAQADTKEVRGMIQVRRGDYEKAIPNLTAASRARPRSFAANYNLAVAYHANGDYRTALSIVYHLQQDGIDRKELRLLKARCLEKVGGPKPAFEEIDNLPPSEPEWPPTLWFRAHLLHRLGRSTEALQVLGKLPVGQKSVSSNVILRATLLEELDRRSEAIDVLAESFREFRDLRVGRRWLVDLYEAGRLQEAAAMIGPSSDLVDEKYVLSVAASGQWSDLADGALVAADDGDSETVQLALKLLLKAGFFSKAEEVGTRAIREFPQEVPLYLLTGEALRLENRTHEQAQLYLDAPESCRKPPLYAALANVMLDLGELSQAEGFAVLALTGEPTNVEALVARGVVAYRRGDFKEAYSLFSAAADISPNQPTVIRNLQLIKERHPEAVGATVVIG